ncbi:lysophospholipid acyltransferase family protein [Pedococcus sp. NPDC057267]|uniref:lysophospholipid acyltransferase family protein n=1 Tax=Pedococcus sp. NPDC057267 TaxID=3346077 RepID=UPI00363D18CC
MPGPTRKSAVKKATTSRAAATRTSAAKAATPGKSAAEAGATKKAATKAGGTKKAGVTKKAATAKKAPAAKASAATSGAGRASRGATRPGALAAGAARASGERARRRSTPLLGAGPAEARATSASTSTPRDDDATTTTATTTTATATEGAPTAATTPAKHRPRPVAKAVPSTKAVARSGVRAPRATTSRRRSRGSSAARAQDAPVRVLTAVRDEPDEQAFRPGPQPGAGAAGAGGTGPGVEELLTAGVSAIRMAAEGAGLSPDDVERHLAAMLAFVRRRLTGDYTVDDFGFDRDFTEHFYLPVLRPLYRRWFRVEVRGVENIPSEGGALVVANHSGTIAMDSLMTQVAVHDEHPAHRHLRMLGADLVFQTPVIGNVARKSGSTLAANPDAERLLASGELCGVWPEGFKGVGKPFSERYKLQRFGRGGFVSAALRTGVPIIPCSIVGAEEIYPILGNVKTVARLLGAPYAPITPTWPLLGPLGLVPLPSKWIIEFGAPVATADLGPSAADDPMLVFDLTDQVRETIQQTLYSLLMQRRSVFF